MDLIRDLRDDGTWLILPARQVPPVAGWALALFGLAGTLFMLFWIGGAAGWQLPGRGPLGFDAARYAFAALGLPGLAITLGMAVVGLGLTRGLSHCEIGIGVDAVRIRERLGRLQWTWAVPVAQLRGIVTASAAGGQGPMLLLRRAGLGDLKAARAYPPALLQRVGAQLQRELALVATAPIPVVEAPGLGPPPGTLEVEEAGDRIAIAIAPRVKPWWVLVIDLPWLGGVGVVTWTVVEGGGHWITLLFLLPFWAIGIGFLLAFIHGGWQRVSLLWAEGRLTLVDRSPLRRRIRSWDRDLLADVLVVERGSGSGRYEAVAVRPREGKDHDLPLSCDRSAREWIAGRLNRALTGGN